MDKGTLSMVALTGAIIILSIGMIIIMQNDIFLNKNYGLCISTILIFCRYSNSTYVFSEGDTKGGSVMDKETLSTVSLVGIVVTFLVGLVLTMQDDIFVYANLHLCISTFFVGVFFVVIFAFSMKGYKGGRTK